MGTLSGTATFVSPLALGVSSKREELALSVLLVTVDSFFFFFFFLNGYIGQKSKQGSQMVSPFLSYKTCGSEGKLKFRLYFLY